MENTESSSDPGLFEANSLPVTLSAVTFASLALYNAIEICTLLLVIFKRYRGLYFWSLLVTTTLGVSLNAIGVTLFYFRLTLVPVCDALITFSWMVMSTGHCLVLYSRLHFLLYKKVMLRVVLLLIVGISIAIYIPVIVLTVRSYAYLETDTSDPGNKLLAIFQLAIFAALETFICVVYIYQSYVWLGRPVRNRRPETLFELIAINVSIILMNVILIVLGGVGLWAVQLTLKPATYSIKLKLELAVLGQLRSIARGGVDGGFIESDPPISIVQRLAEGIKRKWRALAKPGQSNSTGDVYELRHASEGRVPNGNGER